MQAQLLPGAGALITDLDLAAAVPESVIADLRALYLDRHLLIFRDQSLSPERQIEVTGWFGPVRVGPDGAIGYVSNVRPNGIVPEGPLPFHSDMSFTEHPVRGISLYALEIPAAGGSTRFANAAAAVAQLPAATRDALSGRAVLNIAGYGANFATRRKERDCDPREPRAEHPAIDVHPDTGGPVLRINGLSTAHVVGLAEEESDRLLDEVLGVLYSEGNIHEHHWRVGDYVVFDNVAVHHARGDFDAGEARTLQRVVLDDADRFEPGPEVAALYQAAGAGRVGS